MHVPIREILCAHIIEMVRGLQPTPVSDEFPVLGREHALFERIYLRERFRLDGVGAPGREVTLFVRPGNEFRHIHLVMRREPLDGFGWRREAIVRMREHGTRQGPEKFENT